RLDKHAERSFQPPCLITTTRLMTLSLKIFHHAQRPATIPSQRGLAVHHVQLLSTPPREIFPTVAQALTKIHEALSKDLWPLDPSKAPRCAPLRLALVIAYPMPNPYLLKLQGLWSGLITEGGRNSPRVQKLRS